MKEIWKSIEGFPDYQVSSLGRIVRVAAGKRTRPGLLLTPCDNGKGYAKTRLRTNGASVSVNFHRIVAIAFIPNPNNLPYVLSGEYSHTKGWYFKSAAHA